MFYRDLGVSTHASRSEIRKAYQEQGGEEDVRLTMIVGVLLNPTRRLHYDLTPLGSLFFDDEIEEAMRIAAATEAGQTRAEGGEVDTEALNKHLEELREPIEEIPQYADRYPWSYYLLNSECTDVETLSYWRWGISLALWKLFPFDRPRVLALGFMGDEEDDFRFALVGYRMVCLVNDHLPFSLEASVEAANMIVNTGKQ